MSSHPPGLHETFELMRIRGPISCTMRKRPIIGIHRMTRCPVKEPFIFFSWSVNFPPFLIHLQSDHLVGTAFRDAVIASTTDGFDDFPGVNRGAPMPVPRSLVAMVTP